MRRNGFARSREPILKPLGTIECRDAGLTPQGDEPARPAADVVIGNPPLLDGKLLIATLGERYASDLSWKFVRESDACGRPPSAGGVGKH